MSPEKRVLKQIMISDAEKANNLFTILMGMDVAPRRKFLEEHAGDVKFSGRVAWSSVESQHSKHWRRSCSRATSTTR